MTGCMSAKILKKNFQKKWLTRSPVSAIMSTKERERTMKYLVKMNGETMEFKNWLFFASWFRKLNAENGNCYEWEWVDVRNRIVRVYEKA